MTSSSSPARDVSRLYGDVADSIAAAMRELDALDVEHVQGKQEVGGMLERLRSMQADFDDELRMLEEHAEWDKFTIAFFGETNAGKSTIIESLRILFKEESRQRLLEQNGRDVARYEQVLTGHVDTVRQSMLRARAAVAAEIAAVRADFGARSATLLDQTAARAGACKVQVAALEGALQHESGRRAEVESALAQCRATAAAAEQQFTAALARARRMAWQAAAGGVLAGAAVCGLVLLALP